MQAKKVVIPYRPRSVFADYHNRSEQFAVLVARRRGGKSVAAINDEIRRAICNSREFPQPRYAFIGPQFKQTRRNIWAYLKHYAGVIPGTKINESNFEVTLPNGALIYIDGADNPDAIRGGYLDGVVLDEYQDMKPLALETVIMPMLSDYNGWLTITGSAKGRNQLHKTLEFAQQHEGWFWRVIRYSEYKWDDEKAVETLRGLIPHNVFEQEYECNFDAAIEGAYYGKELEAAERDGRVGDFPYNPDYPVHTAWDIGVSDYTAIWFWQIIGNRIRVIDYYENMGFNSAHYVKVVKSKPYNLGDTWVPHDARQREWTGSGAPDLARQRIETLVSLGLNVRKVPNASLMDGINALRMTLARMEFHETTCRYLLETLKQYQTEFDPKANAFKTTPRHDWTSHAADSGRYTALAWREIIPDIKPKDPIAELLKPRTISDVVGEIGFERDDD